MNSFETSKKAYPLKRVQIQSGVKDREERTADGKVAVLKGFTGELSRSQERWCTLLCFCF